MATCGTWWARVNEGRMPLIETRHSGTAWRRTTAMGPQSPTVLDQPCLATPESDTGPACAVFPLHEVCDRDLSLNGERMRGGRRADTERGERTQRGERAHTERAFPSLP